MEGGSVVAKHNEKHKTKLTGDDIDIWEKIFRDDECKVCYKIKPTPAKRKE